MVQKFREITNKLAPAAFATKPVQYFEVFRGQLQIPIFCVRSIACFHSTALSKVFAAKTQPLHRLLLALGARALLDGRSRRNKSNGDRTGERLRLCKNETIATKPDVDAGLFYDRNAYSKKRHGGVEPRL